MSILDDLAASFVSTPGVYTYPNEYAVTEDMPDPPGVTGAGWFLGISGLENAYTGVMAGTPVDVTGGYTTVLQAPDPNGHATATAWKIADGTPPDITTWVHDHDTNRWGGHQSCGVWLNTSASGPIQEDTASGGGTALLPSDPTPGNVLILVAARYGGLGAYTPANGGIWTLLGQIQNLFSNNWWIGALGYIVQPGDTAADVAVLSGTLAWVSEWPGSAVIPPTADFVADHTSVLPGQTVHFTDTSDEGSSPITTWSWTGDDGGSGFTSSLQNPSHVYDHVGVYTVALTVTSADGSDTETKLLYIHVGTSIGLDVFTINPPGTSYEAVGTMHEATQKSIRPVLNAPGSGIYTINRNSPEATAEAIAPGNFVKVRIPEIDDNYIFAFFMDQGDFTLLSADEEGGEDFTFGGDGLLSYLNRAVWRNYKYSVQWWPEDVSDPPDGAEGLLRVKAGKYRFYLVGGTEDVPLNIIYGGPGLSYIIVEVVDFDAYFHDFRMYRWPQTADGSITSHIDLAHIMTGQPHQHDFMAPFDNASPIETIFPSWTAASGEPILLTNVASTPGAVLHRMIVEAQHPSRPAQPIPLVTYDFDETNDSNGDPWTETEALEGLSADPGEDYLTTLAKLVNTGVLDVYMDPDFGLHAFNSPSGRDLTGTSFGTGTVRFAKAVNIAEEMKREMLDRRVATHAEVQSNVNGGYQRAVAELADADERVTREIGVFAEATEIEHEMVAVGEAALLATLQASDALTFEHITGDDDAHGVYLPGPEGTDHGKYWLGDTVTVHTGTGEQDYDEASLEVAAVTITDTESGALRALPELVSPTGQAERDLFGSGFGAVSGGRGSGGYAPRPIGGTPPPSDLSDVVAATSRPSAAVSIQYTFDSTTTDSDPGAGKLRLSNGTQSSSVTVRADNADANGVTVTALLDLLSSGRLRLVHATDPTKWVTFDVSAVVDATGYRNITVSDVQHSATSPFTNGDPLVLLADLGSAAAGDPSTDTAAWMPLTTVVGGEPVLVWDGDDSLIPTLTPL